jgi:hypothetical protein
MQHSIPKNRQLRIHYTKRNTSISSDFHISTYKKTVWEKVFDIAAHRPDIRLTAVVILDVPGGQVIDLEKIFSSKP